MIMMLTGNASPEHGFFVWENNDDCFERNQMSKIESNVIEFQINSQQRLSARHCNFTRQVIRLIWVEWEFHYENLIWTLWESGFDHVPKDFKSIFQIRNAIALFFLFARFTSDRYPLSLHQALSRHLTVLADINILRGTVLYFEFFFYLLVNCLSVARKKIANA